MKDSHSPNEHHLTILTGTLDRARRYGTGLTLFVIYQSEECRKTFERALIDRLTTIGQRIRRERFYPNTPPASHDLPTRLIRIPPAPNEVVFVYDLQYAFPEILRAFNYRRELIPENRWRLLFWATDAEVARIMRDAPDFWAFVNEIFELPGEPQAESTPQPTTLPTKSNV